MRFDEVFQSFKESYYDGFVIFEGTLYKELERISYGQLLCFIVGGSYPAYHELKKDGLHVFCKFKYNRDITSLSKAEQKERQKFIRYFTKTMGRRRAVSFDIVEKIRKLSDDGLTHQELADKFDISTSTVYLIIHKRGPYAVDYTEWENMSFEKHGAFI